MKKKENVIEKLQNKILTVNKQNKWKTENYKTCAEISMELTES